MLHINLKGITKCSNMVANILPADPPPPPHDPRGWGQQVIIQLFQNMVMLHITLNGITKCSNMVAIFLPANPPYPYDPRGMGSKGQNSEHGHVAYQIKGNHEFSNMVASILPAYPPPHPGNGVNRSKFNFFRTWSCYISN